MRGRSSTPPCFFEVEWEEACTIHPQHRAGLLSTSGWAAAEGEEREENAWHLGQRRNV